MADIITVIAYKEDAVESYRNCVVDRYGSAFDIFSSTNPESVIDHVTKMKADDLDSYNTFDFTFLINGRCVHYDAYYVSEDIPDDLDYDIISAHEELISTIIREADARVAVIVVDRKDAAEKAAQQKKLQEERAKERRERDQLAILKDKYGA